MPNHFTLLRQLSAKAKSSEKELVPLEGLKKITESYMDIYNQIVEQVWALNIELAKSDDKGKTELTHRLSEITQLFEDCKSQKQIEELLVRIKSIEIVENGTSKIGCGSPYKL